MKTLLIVSFGVLCAAALLFPAWALRRRIAAPDTRRAENIAAYTARCAELRADVGAGRLTEDDYTQLEAEAANDLVHTARDASPDSGVGGRWPVVLAMVIVPLVATMLYLASGGLPPMSRDEQVSGLMAQLQARVEAAPTDVQAWQMLGRAYMATERYDDAADAYRRVNELTDAAEPDWLVAEGEALGFAREQDLLGRPATLFDAALAIDASHPRALWYASLAASQQGNRERTVVLLQRLARQDLEARFADAVRQALTSLGARVPEADSPQPSATGPSLAVTVRVADGLPVADGATLFVFAKAAGGAPMPLAVQRVASPRFPVTVVLDENSAMTESGGLSTADTWEITARLSRSGDARPGEGDLQGQQTLAATDAAEGVTVVINEVIQ